GGRQLLRGLVRLRAALPAAGARRAEALTDRTPEPSSNGRPRAGEGECLAARPYTGRGLFATIEGVGTLRHGRHGRSLLRDRRRVSKVCAGGVRIAWCPATRFGDRNVMRPYSLTTRN